MTTAQLKMVRRSLTDLPPISLYDGVTIRTYREGDEALWAEIMNDNDMGEWTVESVKKSLVDQPVFDPMGLFFADYAGRTIGSACAWKMSEEEKDDGRLHMVCVRGDARGMGVGRSLIVRVLQYFAEHGFSQSTLTTDDHRLPAITCYLELGYEPFYVDETHKDRWKEVFSQIEDYRRNSGK